MIFYKNSCPFINIHLIAIWGIYFYQNSFPSFFTFNTQLQLIHTFIVCLQKCQEPPLLDQTDVFLVFFSSVLIWHRHNSNKFERKKTKNFYFLVFSCRAVPCRAAARRWKIRAVTCRAVPRHQISSVPCRCREKIWADFHPWFTESACQTLICHPGRLLLRARRSRSAKEDFWDRKSRQIWRLQKRSRRLNGEEIYWRGPMRMKLK